MYILVANLGSTSFKYRLFRVEGTEPALVTKGGYERVSDYEACIGDMLAALKADGCLAGEDDVSAVGFKTVLGKDLSGCVEGDDVITAALEGFTDVAPAHNPAYAAGIRSFARRLPMARRVALFETAFYQWVPEAAAAYALPKAWRDLGIRRYGFHGASHKFVAERSAECLGNETVAERVRKLYVSGPGDYDGPPLRVVSCHLGGSSSVTGIHNGIAIGTSMGFSPQSGLPQNNRVGDLDAMAITYAAKKLGASLDELERQLTKEGGLLGLSGVSNDVRDIDAAIADGNSAAALAIDVLVDSIVHYTGAFMLKMGGLDAICFTAGIGENDARIRARVCEALEPFGLTLDPATNAAAIGGTESVISADGSAVRALVLPANEELVIAREVTRYLRAHP